MRAAGSNRWATQACSVRRRSASNSGPDPDWLAERSDRVVVQISALPARHDRGPGRRERRFQRTRSRECRYGSRCGRSRGTRFHAAQTARVRCTDATAVDVRLSSRSVSSWIGRPPEITLIISGNFTAGNQTVPELRRQLQESDRNGRSSPTRLGDQTSSDQRRARRTTHDRRLGGHTAIRSRSAREAVLSSTARREPRTPSNSTRSLRRGWASTWAATV